MHHLLLLLNMALAPKPRCGMLVVGLAGNNGVTLTAGKLANQKSLVWESARDGPKSANYLGCITQVGALPKKFSFPSFDDCAVGGWDVVPTPLGEALYQSRILDYDLVRQVRSEMDSIPVMPGVWDPDFYGESQHAGATYTVPESTRSEQLERLRDDIRNFKAEHNLVGESGEEAHTTVIWSASVERPCEEYETADDLLDAIRRDDKEAVSPSLLYAAAAILEGCSFVNGGSQNTIQPALLDLAATKSPSSSTQPYVLGTDFKAGQTKAKTAIVEYLRALGLLPRTIASYNHLGNNDMKNLLSPRTWKAKARVKTDVFGAWADDGPIDHKVAVLYTEQMGDEKRDTVEYTSDAFMGCEHTMLTYTRCMDSALCVPLMIDVAIFCEYLSKRGAEPEHAAAALAYLFKVNEGAAIGVDPGFFNQSTTLRNLLERLPDEAPAQQQQASRSRNDGDGSGRMLGSVLCAGLSCVDMQLLRADSPQTAEAIARFNGCEVAAGGSASNAASALRAMGVDAAVLTFAGEDVHGAELTRIYESQGIDTTLLLTDPKVSTSLAVLPVFEAGGRGCWVDLSANDQLTPEAMLAALKAPDARHIRDSAKAVLVGYPHLLKNLKGEALESLLVDAAKVLADSAEVPLLAVDVNGATLGAFADADGTLAPSLSLIDVLHANLEEACHIVGIEEGVLSEADATREELRKLVEPLLAAGTAIVAVTLGARGAYVAVSDDPSRLDRSALLRKLADAGWVGGEVLSPALPLEGELNANGAGDAFTAGLLAAMLWRRDGDCAVGLEEAVMVALGSARQRVDAARRGRPEGVEGLLSA